MKVIFTFSDSSTYESSIIRQGFSCQEILFNRLQASDGFVGFSIPFSTTFSNKMTADINNNVLAIVYDDNNNPYATGFVKKEVGYEQKYRNQPIKITIVSKSYMLDKTLNESYALESCTSGQIVTWLLTQAGISDIGSLSSMTTTVPLFVFNAGENIKDVLKEFCFEYSKTFYFDKNGYFQVADLFISSFTASQTFDRSNIRDKVNINVKEAEANCIRGRWTPLSLVSDTLVFEDKQNATSQYDCVIPIAANSWFGGVEDNFLKCDSTLGEVKYVKAITQNNIQSDTGITKTLDLLERTSLNQLHFTARNTTASVKNITKMQVYANAYIAKENRVDVTTYGNKEKELSLKYIQDQTTAQNFVKALADYYNSTSFTVSFSSDEVCDIGDLVTVSADGIGSFNCRIIQRTRNIITDTIDYVCENIGDYTPAVIVQTVQEPLAVNIAGGQKGLDGAPGAPGEDGKNAITMTSSTTPSGEYNGQIGFWQGQPYMWNGSSWVKQIGDLPTDAVLHYSFDDLPDYPDGNAVERYDNNLTTDGWIDTATPRSDITASNGILHVQQKSDGTNYNLIIRRNSFVYSDSIGKIVRFKIKVHKGNISATPIIELGDVGYLNISIKEYDQWQDCIFIIPETRPSGWTNNRFFIGVTFGEANADNYYEISEFYFGDGSYSTPIIDNANGQNNATNNGGLAVQGVSGKGLITVSQDSKIVLSNGVLPLKRTFSIWCWFPNTDWGSSTKRLWRFNLADYVNLDIINNLHRITAISKNTANDIIFAYFNIEQLLEQWIHIVIVDDFSTNGGSKTIYINGKNVAQTVATGDFTGVTDANPWTLLSYSHISQNGAIEGLKADDFLFFNRALSETEVLALYQNKANTPKYFTKSDYDLDAIDDDSKISPSEKIELLSKWKEIYNAVNVSSTLPTTNITATGEYKALIDDATAVGIEGLQEITDYKNASNAIRDVLWNSSTGYLIPANANKVTDVTAGALDTLFSTYRQCLQKSRTKISQQQASVASALTISNANPYCLIPVAGGTPNYNNTDNRLQVFNGTTLLTPKSSSTTLSDGQWKVTASGSNITAGSQTVSSTYIDFGNVSNMTSDNATITFTIETRVNGVTNTMYAVQKFAKSVAAADGASYKLIATAYCVKTGTSVTFDAQKNTGGSNENFKGYLYKNTGSGWSKKGQFINGTAYASISETVSSDTAYRLCKTDSASDFVDETSVKIFRDGTDGVSPTVTGTTMQYCQTATNVQPSSGWGNMPSSLTAGYYLWTKTTITYSDGSTAVSYSSTRNGSNGTNGTNGTSVTITSKSIQYQASSSGTSVPTGTWTDSVPTVSNGQYLWTRTVVNYSDGNSTTSYSIGYKGTNGINGNRGGQYLGASSTDPTSGIVSGDYYFNNGSGSTKGGYIRSYNGSSWSNETMNVSNAHVFEAINDIIAWVGDTTHSSISIYTTDQSIANAYVDKLLVGTAFIDKLLVKKLHLLISGQNIGAIYGGKYDENGNIDSQSSATKGVFLDANGEFKCSDGTFSGDITSENYSASDGTGYHLGQDGSAYFNNIQTKNLSSFYKLAVGDNYLLSVMNSKIGMTTSQSLNFHFEMDKLVGYIVCHIVVFDFTEQTKISAKLTYNGSTQTINQGEYTTSILLNSDGSKKTVDISLSPSVNNNHPIVAIIQFKSNISKATNEYLFYDVQSHISVTIDDKWYSKSIKGNIIEFYCRHTVAKSLSGTVGGVEYLPMPIVSNSNISYGNNILELQATPYATGEGAICGLQAQQPYCTIFLPIYYGNKNQSTSITFGGFWVSITGYMYLGLIT